MQIVIDIPEKVYKSIQDNDYCGISNADMYNAVKNGIPIPKGHGRLIDANELYGDFIDGTEGYDCQTWNRIEIGDIIEDAPTIIEADTESDHKCHTCKHYTSGENDGSCGSYICKGYSNWESEEQA